MVLLLNMTQFNQMTELLILVACLNCVAPHEDSWSGPLQSTNSVIFCLFGPSRSNFPAVPPVFAFPRKLPSIFAWKHKNWGLVLHYSLSPPWLHLPFGSDPTWHHNTHPCDGRICPEISVDLVRQNPVMQEFSHLPCSWCHVVIGFPP